MRTHGAGYECDEFPGDSHDHDPAKAFAVNDCQRGLSNGEEAKKHSEGDGSEEGGRVGPLCVAGFGGYIAVVVGGEGDAGGECGCCRGWKEGSG